MAAFSRVTPTGWSQGDDASAIARVSPSGWDQVAASASGTTITGALGTATATGYTASLNINRTISGALGTATASGFQATVSNSTDTTITGALGTAVASGFTATVNANRTIAGSLGTAVASGFQAGVTNDNSTRIDGALGIVVATGYTATLGVNRLIAGILGEAFASGFTGNVDAGGLIGRKYPRRGRSRPRKIVEIPEETLPEVSQKILAEKQELEEELASAQADLVLTQQMAHNTVNRAKRVKELTSVIGDLEHNLNVRREEEVLLMLTLMALEM